MQDDRPDEYRVSGRGSSWCPQPRSEGDHADAGRRKVAKAVPVSHEPLPETLTLDDAFRAAYFMTEQ
jgi:hypothetical protein